ncbi:MAG: hypothetical protein EBU08_12935 [Micrococcales bacterium]|nr:hypothetical protein [Micrococcales bacterium]
MILSEYDALQEYDQMLDDVYPEVILAGCFFLPSRILKEMDIHAYNEGFQAFVESLYTDGTYVEGYTDDLEESMDDSMDGDHDSAMASAGFGTDEDYGYAGDDAGGED